MDKRFYTIVNEITNPVIIIAGTGNHFYRYGLSLFRFDSQYKRSRFYNPFVIFIINIVFVIKLLIDLIIIDFNERIQLLVGNWIYFLGHEISRHLGIEIIIY